jgi:hypothetical protein
VALVGTSRTVNFTSGLNIVEGPISTGKTSLMRLLAIVLGGDYDGVSPEVDAAVSQLAADVTIGDGNFAIVRRLMKTPTAWVQIAGDGVAERLPAMRLDPTSVRTYGTWLLDVLGLPTLRVPQAPTRPEESVFVPVSINDYIRYCRIRQDEIDVDVLGSSFHFRDVKRRYVFRILYGGYDAEVARLQDELRQLQLELTQLEQGSSAFERFLAGTALENRAEINRQLDAALARRAAIQSDRHALAEAADVSPDVVALRTGLTELTQRVSDLQTEMEREQADVRELEELSNELRTQLARLTRAIVADERFFDFDFVVCPRCGSALDSNRSDDAHCYLCLQEPPPAPTREDLIAEQDRVGAQIVETQDLVATHLERASALKGEIAALDRRRAGVSAKIDDRLATFVSSQADRIEVLARTEAEAAAAIERLEEYASLFGRLDEAARRIDELSERREEIEAALERAEQLDAVTATRMATLERWFAHYVEALEIPVFPGEPRAGIDPLDYEPIVNGRKFPELSAGVRVLVNVAHLLAHHRAALELSLPLPGLLMIDGINKNIGKADYDAARIEDVWTQLIALADELPDDLQIIVAANDVPDRAREFVQLTLSAEDRLIPEADLQRYEGRQARSPRESDGPSG